MVASGNSGSAAACYCLVLLLAATSLVLVTADDEVTMSARRLTATGCAGGGISGCKSVAVSKRWGSGSGPWSGGGGSSGGSNGGSNGGSGGNGGDYKLICNGQLQYISIPNKVNDGSGNSQDGQWEYPDGLSCARRTNGFCGASPRIACSPFSNNIGPVNLGLIQDADGLKNEFALPPENPLVFSLNLDRSFFVFLNWTVFDVGSGGAKFVAKYSNGRADTQTHQWTPNGPQTNGNSDCGACTSCVVGQGIKTFTAESDDPNGGFESFELSQLFRDIRCGASCFDSDASYWQGMEYVCVGPTCGDTDPTQQGDNKFRCTPSDAWEYNPRASSNTTLTNPSCCLKRTCAAPDPSTRPNEPFDCSQFNKPPVGNTPGEECVMKNPMDTTSTPGKVACCDCKTIPPTPPGVQVIKTVAAARRRRTKKNKKKKKNTKKTVASAAAVEEEDVIIASSMMPGDSVTVGAGSPVVFTIQVKPEGNGGSSGAVTGVQLTDTLPAGLTLTGVSGDNGACNTFGNSISCNWLSINAGDVKTITVSALTTQTGVYENCATVTANNDQNPSNNRDCATVFVNPSCADFNSGSPGPQPFPCPSFSRPPTPTQPGQNCTMKTPMDTTSVPSVETCCTCVTIPFNTVDIEVVKTVTARRRRTKKKKNTKKGVSAAAVEEEAIVVPASGPPASTVVGSTVTWSVVVRHSSESLGTATNVRLNDLVPSSLEVTGVTENPPLGACSALGNSLSCTWASLPLGETRTITVTTRTTTAGTFENCARVSATADANPANNQDCATVVVRGACCTGSTCQDTLPGECPRIPGSQQFYPDLACMDQPCTPSGGACCINNNCVEGLTSTACANALGQFYPSQTCAQLNVANICPKKDVGACCLTRTGRCVDKQTRDTCVQAGGVFWLDVTCVELTELELCGTPIPPDDLGACCTPRNGDCRDNVRQSECDPSTSNWVKGAKCGLNGFCAGSCCNPSNPATCSQTSKAQCPYVWKIYGDCEKDCGSSTCSEEWEPCKPNDPSESCCPGLTCQYTWPGCKVGSYVCKKTPNNQCVSSGQPCGGSSGQICCKGLTCKWDYYSKQGSCQPIGPCAGPGDGCNSDYDTCRGCRCFGGKSKFVTYKMCYKPCSHYGCYLQRSMNCGAFYASAASL